MVAATLLPLLIVQGKYARRTTPRLPEATGPRHGVVRSEVEGFPLSLLVVGESPIAGVGVERQADAITPQFAQGLAKRFKRQVTWQACGKNGIKASQALSELLSDIPRQPVDILLVAFGVNDTTAFHSVARWRSDLRELLDALQTHCEPGLLIVSGVPPMAKFTALPQPLRWVMGLKARALDAETVQLVATRAASHYVGLRIDPTQPELMASDGYHPSKQGCREWAHILIAALPKHLIAPPSISR